MKTAPVLAAFYGLIARTHAHFAGAHLLVNGTDLGAWTYVLKTYEVIKPWEYGNLPNDSQIGYVMPMGPEVLKSENMTCGRSPWYSFPNTKIADIIAGSEVGFRTLNRNEVKYWDTGEYSYFYHPGVASVWLSKAPNNQVNGYHGDGDWFKIAYAGPKNNTAWKLYEATPNSDKPETFHDTFNFTVPATTPPGQYLMRLEYISPSAVKGNSQWFANCALVNIIGSGGGTPTGLVKFPGAYDPEDAGIWIPMQQDMSLVPKEQLRITEYVPPGPAVWSG